MSRETDLIVDLVLAETAEADSKERKELVIFKDGSTSEVAVNDSMSVCRQRRRIRRIFLIDAAGKMEC
jgi:hypothetical protein